MDVAERVDGARRRAIDIDERAGGRRGRRRDAGRIAPMPAGRRCARADDDGEDRERGRATPDATRADYLLTRSRY